MKKAMVVVGTGLCKIYLSAFDNMNFNKMSFVTHRDELLRDIKKYRIPSLMLKRF